MSGQPRLRFHSGQKSGIFQFTVVYSVGECMLPGHVFPGGLRIPGGILNEPVWSPNHIWGGTDSPATSPPSFLPWPRSSQCTGITALQLRNLGTEDLRTRELRGLGT